VKNVEEKACIYVVGILFRNLVPVNFCLFSIISMERINIKRHVPFKHEALKKIGRERAQKKKGETRP